MEERTIEVNVISASDLKNVKTFGGLQTSYVVAYIFPQQKRSTKVDTKGGLNPTWNSKLTFTCDERVLEKGGSYLTLEIYSQGSLSDKLIGTVSIPLHIPISTGGKDAKKVDGTPAEYTVRRPSGDAKGFLKVAVKLGEKRTIQTYKGTQSGYAYSQEYKKESRPAYPPASYGASNALDGEYKKESRQSYPPASYGASNAQYYPGSYVSSAPAGGVYPPQNTDGISPYSASQGGVYPPPSQSSKTDSTLHLSGYSTSGGTTGVNPVYSPVYPPTAGASTSSGSSSSSSEPAMAYPAVGYPVGTGYPQYGQQYYPPQGYPPQNYSQHQAPYYAQQPYYSTPPKRHSSGSGMGTGLLAGALGGLLLGDIFD